METDVDGRGRALREKAFDGVVGVIAKGIQRGLTWKCVGFFDDEDRLVFVEDGIIGDRPFVFEHRGVSVQGECLGGA